MHSLRLHLLVRHILAVNGGRITFGEASISTSPVDCNANYYEDLGISQNSTQSEIKAAYYKLSMLYHPDKNQGNKSAVKKFREITQAYEVLGNYRLRRLYDKGIIHTAGPIHAHHPEHPFSPKADVEDDPSTKFYKSRFRKSTVSDTMGRTPIYDFDEWSRAHYGTSFQRRKAAKEKYERSEANKLEHKLIAQNEILFVGLGILLGIFYVLHKAESSYDIPKRRAIQAANENKKKTKS